MIFFKTDSKSHVLGRIKFNKKLIISRAGQTNLSIEFKFARQCNAECGCESAKLYPVWYQQTTGQWALAPDIPLELEESSNWKNIKKSILTSMKFWKKILNFSFYFILLKKPVPFCYFKN